MCFSQRWNFLIIFCAYNENQCSPVLFGPQCSCMKVWNDAGVNKCGQNWYFYCEITIFSPHDPFITVFHYRSAGSDRYSCEMSVLILRMNIQTAHRSALLGFVLLRWLSFNAPVLSILRWITDNKIHPLVNVQADILWR